MSNNTPNLVWLRTFEASARLLNFTEAGKELGLTQTAVSLHIKSLEARLGCPLFLRKPRSLELTNIGQAYVHTVRKALSDINLSTASLFGRAVDQTVTIRVSVSTACHWLAPLLPSFLEEHPGINIRLVSTIWANTIDDEVVDIDLRIGLGDWSGLQVEKISTETVVPVGAANMKDEINDVADLLRYPGIHILGYEDNWNSYLSAHGLSNNNTQARSMVDTSAAALAMVMAEGGVAIIFTRFAESALRSGYPISILGKPIEHPQAHYLTNSIAQSEPRPDVAIVRSWIKSCF